MARIWTNYRDQSEFIDLTKHESDEQVMNYKREDISIPLLDPRQMAIIKYVWILRREEKDLLSAFFINKVKASRFLTFLEIDKREVWRLKVSHYSLIMNFVNGNVGYFKRVLEEEGDFWLLVSCRINYKSNFYECLVKRVWELSDTEERAVEL